MKKLLLFAYICFAAMGVTTGCHFAKEEPLGDTVAASVFSPKDTTTTVKKDVKQTAQAVVTDSTDLFYIGEGSSKHYLQLLSYPSRRDTFTYGKTAHIKVEGCADFGRVVRVKYYILPSGDSLVSRVMEKQD